MKSIIGIDPGSKGFVTYMPENGTMEFYAIPDGDMRDLYSFLKYCKERSDEIIAIKEDVHALLNSSAKSTFSFGYANGMIEGMLIALEIPYVLIQPKKWQSGIWINQDKEYVTKKNDKGELRRSVDTKHTSYNAARRLFPQIDLRRTPKCKNFDDNKTDSLLIAEYARRNNL